MKRVLDIKKEQFIKDNYLQMSWKQMAEALNVPKATVASCMRRNGWQVPDEVKLARRVAGIQER